MKQSLLTEGRHFETAVSLLRNNQIVALPSESVYGLSARVCRETTDQLIQLKKRPLEKGFIIVSGVPEQLLRYIDTSRLNAQQVRQIQTPSERATSWVVPVKKDFIWLTGKYHSIAVRLTTHPLLRAITERLGEAIISTSANLSGEKPLRSKTEIEGLFGQALPFVYPSLPPLSSKPSRIINVMTGKILRA